MTSALPVPKYHQVYLVLREQLHEGRFADGVPGEIALMHEFGVARVTVRKALERLAAERLIRRTPGRGTVPLPPAQRRGGAREAVTPERLSGLYESLLTMGLVTSVKVLSAQRAPCPAAVAQALRLEVGTPVQKVQRVRLVREGPLSHITTYMPLALAQFSRRQLARKPLLALLEDAGVRIGRGVQTLSARLADAEVAPHLGVEVGSALLSVQRLIFDEREQPVQWLLSQYRPDRYEYRMELAREGGADTKVWVGSASSAALQ